MFIDNIKNQLAAYKAAPLINDVAAKLDFLQDSFKPVSKFFNNIQKKSASSKLSNEEKQAADEEAMEAARKVMKRGKIPLGVCKINSLISIYKP